MIMSYIIYSTDQRLSLPMREIAVKSAKNFSYRVKFSSYNSTGRVIHNVNFKINTTLYLNYAEWDTQSLLLYYSVPMVIHNMATVFVLSG